MRTCPFKDCGKPIPEERFACPRHWFSLNKDQQKEIWASYKGYLAGQIPVEILRDIQETILEEVQGGKS